MGIVHAKELENEDESRKVDFKGIQAQVKKVHVDGLGRTKEDVVVGSVKDVFTATDLQTVILKIHEARVKLQDLGCFKNVGVFIDTCGDHGAASDAIEVTFEVKESNLLGAKLHTSIGNNEGSISSGMSVNNVFGRGEKLTSDYSYGNKKTSSFITAFTKPFHDRASTALSTNLFQLISEAPWSGFREMNRGANVSVAFNSADNVDQKIVLEGVWRNLSCMSRSTCFAVREQSGHSLKTSLRHELNWDTRDDAIFPSNGTSFVLKNELAGFAGDVRFMKNELELQANLTVFNSLVIQGALNAGHLWPQGGVGRTTSIADRFTLGGSSSVRGFEIGGIGPHADGYSLGAQMFWASGLHLYCPLPFLAAEKSSGSGGSFSEKFKLHAFVNSGNLGNFALTEDYKQNLRTLLRDMRLSYGGGLAMNLGGIARVELNYVIPLMLQRSDRPHHGVQFGISSQFL